MVSISPYEIALISYENPVIQSTVQFHACLGCVFQTDAGNCQRDRGLKFYSCVDGQFRIVHRVSGRVLTDEEIVEEYENHKTEQGVSNVFGIRI